MKKATPESTKHPPELVFYFNLIIIFSPCGQLGSPQQKPKRLRVLADVSGSMYRFNGVDGRLERSMEAVCMVMEALESYEHKFKVREVLLLLHQSGSF